jgi:hypothetical protein
MHLALITLKLSKFITTNIAALAGDFSSLENHRWPFQVVGAIVMPMSRNFLYIKNTVCYLLTNEKTKMILKFSPIS